MSDPTNNNSEDVFNQLNASLRSAQTCLEVFADNGKYPTFCQSQKNPEIAAVTDKLLTQFERLRGSAQNYLTPSYSTENTKKSRHTP